MITVIHRPVSQDEVFGPQGVLANKLKRHNHLISRELRDIFSIKLEGTLGNDEIYHICHIYKEIAGRVKVKFSRI